MDEHYKQLEGWTLKQYLGSVKHPDGTEFPSFIISKKGEEDYIIDVSCDPEGNGAGFLHIREFRRETLYPEGVFDE